LVCFPTETVIVDYLDCYSPYIFNNDTLYKIGSYDKVYKGYNGCDSTVKLILTRSFNENNDLQTLTFCKNIEYYFAGKRITKSGSYFQLDTLPSGCIFYRTRFITVVDKYSFLKEVTVHEGDTVRNIRMGAIDTIFQDKYISFGGCDSIYTLYVHVIPLKTSLNSVTENMQITLYPNPVFNALEIDIKTNMNELKAITIYDVDGKVYHQSKLKSDKFSINTEGWHSGLFWVKVESENGVTVKKILKI
jgi:Secretion system C-terminal sorting domain